MRRHLPGSIAFALTFSISLEGCEVHFYQRILAKSWEASDTLKKGQCRHMTSHGRHVIPKFPQALQVPDDIVPSCAPVVQVVEKTILLPLLEPTEVLMREKPCQVLASLK
jgi:hypothetical protein